MIQKFYICTPNKSEAEQINNLFSDYKIESKEIKIGTFSTLEFDVINLFALSAEYYGKNPLPMDTQIILNTNPYIPAKYVVPSPTFPTSLELSSSEMFKEQIEIPLNKVLEYENLRQVNFTYAIHTEIAFCYEENFEKALEKFLEILKNYPQLKKS
ncbi:MAG: hypothetical protein JST55_13000 [Bacteroidetes bacterium]|nr:hypothetical protein [Bacteroidota bacterium]